MSFKIKKEVNLICPICKSNSLTSINNYACLPCGKVKWRYSTDPIERYTFQSRVKAFCDDLGVPYGWQLFNNNYCFHMFLLGKELRVNYISMSYDDSSSMFLASNRVNCSIFQNIENILNPNKIIKWINFQ